MIIVTYLDEQKLLMRVSNQLRIYCTCFIFYSKSLKQNLILGSFKLAGICRCARYGPTGALGLIVQLCVTAKDIAYENAKMKF